MKTFSKMIHISVNSRLVHLQASDLLDKARGNKIEILEDKFGKIQLKGANEIELQSAEHFVQLVRVLSSIPL